MRLPRGLFGGREGGREAVPVEPKTGTDAWVRWTWTWYAAFYVVLTVTTVIVVAAPDTSGRDRLPTVLLAGALAASHAFLVLNQGEWGRRIPLKVSYVAVAATLWFLLVGMHPAYSVLLFVLYGQVYTFLPMRWAIPGSLALTAVVTARSFVDSPGSAPSVVLQGLFWAVFGTFWAFWVYSIIGQSRKRQDLIEELEKTRAELAAEERRAGTLEERGRMAREIHDTLAQDFVSIVTQLEAAEKTLSPGQDEARRLLDRARRTARGGLSESRRLVAALRPEILQGASLAEVLKGVADRWSEETGVEASVSVTGTPGTLAPEAQVALLRAAQEALQNVRKHARASRVDVTLSHVGDAVALDVQDDGGGFDPEEVSTGLEGGFGLAAMRERVESLGGKLQVESEPGGGATLVVELPVGEPAREADKEADKEADREAVS